VSFSAPKAPKPPKPPRAPKPPKDYYSTKAVKRAASLEKLQTFGGLQQTIMTSPLGASYSPSVTRAKLTGR
jgi:hypothetical protein